MLSLAELGHGEHLALGVGDELQSLSIGDVSLHGIGEPPGVPAVWQTCHLCAWTKVLPMYLDRTVVRPNRSIEQTASKRRFARFLASAHRERYAAVMERRR